MFSFFRKKSEDAVRRVTLPQNMHYHPVDACNRAVALFPETAGRKQEIKDTVSIRFHHLLISLEGAERTGCLKITGHTSKARSAVLLFRGRVLGCVYGRKNMRGQYLHEDAHKCAMSDLASPGNYLDAYELPEDLVLSAASLFYGETLDTNYGQNAETSFDYALNALARSGLPGCVVVNTAQEQTVCIVYIAKGKICGVFSATEGWTHGSADSAKRFLRSGPCKVHASILPSTDHRSIGFSLTGLGGRHVAPVQTFDATPPQDFSPTASNVMTQSREAVAQAVRQHRASSEHMSGRARAEHAMASRGRTYARV